MNYIVIENDRVVNVVVMNPDRPVLPPPGATMEPQPDGVGIGYRRISGDWVAPAIEN